LVNGSCERIRQRYPYWSKTPKANFSSINARSDKLESGGAWREPWKHRRCLIPVEFFYEWEPLTKEEGKKKLSKPWAVSLTDDRLFAFDGIRAHATVWQPTWPIIRMVVSAWQAI
jgi:putative SOS response-associated peptidase YedK